MTMSYEFIENKLKELEEKRKSPDYQPMTLPLLKKQLASGEIDKEEYDRLDMLYQFSPEARERRAKEFRRASLKLKF